MQCQNQDAAPAISALMKDPPGNLSHRCGLRGAGCAPGRDSGAQDDESEDQRGGEQRAMACTLATDRATRLGTHCLARALESVGCTRRAHAVDDASCRGA